MKTLLTIMGFITAVTAFGQHPHPFAPTGRLITLELWGQIEATIWAIQSDRIVIYKTFDTETSDILVSEQNLTPEQVKRIQEAVATIPQDAYATLFWKGGLLHGPLFRIGFTPDGSLSGNRLEFHDVFESWLRPLIIAISEFTPQEYKIEFEATVRQRNEQRAKTGDVRPTIRTPISKYYNGKITKITEPNQTLQPTPPLCSPSNQTSSVRRG
jgi:hypothetical protein